MAKDPYKYFRVEARELLDGLMQGVLQLEKGPVSADLVARLLRFAHTFKGAARVVRQPEIAEQAHALEDLLAIHRTAVKPVSKDQASELLRCLDEIGSRVRALEPGAEKPATPSSPSRPPVEESFETVRIDIHEMDALLRDVTEAGIQVGSIRRNLTAVDRLRDLTDILLGQLGARRGDAVSPAILRTRSVAEEVRTNLDQLQRSLTTDVERLESEFAEVRDVAQRLRLVPVQTIFPILDRAVRDAAQSLGKRAELELEGGQVRLDATILAALRDAFLHIVRNAVAHGIESDGERLSFGKPAAGRIRIEIERRGNLVAIRCRDDGRGIDVEAVRSTLVRRGLVPSSEAATLSSEKILQLLLTQKVTTTTVVTAISGRGVGLDVAYETATRLKGKIHLTSQARFGTTVEMRVPVSLASFTGLLVEAAGTVAAIPLETIRRTIRVQEGEVARTTARDSLPYEGQAVPFLPLDRVLRRSGGAARHQTIWSVVMVQVDERLAAVAVDRILGTAGIVMWSLPDVVDADPIIAGASFDAEGNPQLVLDSEALVAAAERGHGSLNREPIAPRAPLLVIDDSLTTRMLEKSILESAGYEVELATSAEEGLAKARERRYGVFVVDVEMPGIDGFEFVTRTRADPDLRVTPAILMTSRNAPEDKQKGKQAGAYAYIVKSEFDQAQLLEIIRTLVG